METEAITVVRRPERLDSTDERVITRYLDLRSVRRIRSVVDRLMRLDEAEVERVLSKAMERFSSRHRDIEAAFMDSYQEVARHLKPHEKISEQRQRLIGAYFTLEYSIESAALFNPSIVAHPDQSGLPTGSVRFLLSLRATGEGHISSIVFRRGVIEADGRISFDPTPRCAYSAKPAADAPLEKALFQRQLEAMGTRNDLVPQVLARLPDRFSKEQLRQWVERTAQVPGPSSALRAAAADMLWLAEANYELRFPPECLPAEIVIFPVTEQESRGMEDLRLVRFVDDDGQVRYHGTYTAFDGSRMFPMLLTSTDFVTFQVRPLSGRYARNKGMALFPRKINGLYTMISRHDGESLYVLRSCEPYFWSEAEKLQTPHEPWELLQIGNCGSPIETEAGWILLTHGVGPVREYCIGATLLDRDDPSRVIGRLKRPFLMPSGAEREGYVPNVVYSCGSMIHKERLIIPYAMSDLATTFATVSVQELLERLLTAGP